MSKLLNAMLQFVDTALAPEHLFQGASGVAFAATPTAPPPGAGLPSLVLIMGFIGILGIGLIVFRRRVESERRLAEEASKFVSLFSHSSDGILLMDGHGTITDANPRAIEATGYPMHILRGMNGLALFHPDDPGDTNLLAGPITSKTTRINCQLRTDAGEHMPVALSLKELPEGLIQAMFHDLSEVRLNEELLRRANIEMASMYDRVSTANEELHREILARGYAEDELREREAMLDTVLRTAPIGIVITKNRKLEWANDPMADMLGYTTEEMRGMSAHKLYASDDEYQRVGQENERQLAEGGSSHLETVFVTKEGEELEILLSSGSIERGNPVAGVVVTVQDITETNRVRQERQEFREIYGVLFEKSRVVELLVDPETGTIIDANGTASVYFGHPRSRMCGMSIDLLCEADKKALLKDQQGESSVRIRVAHSSGEVRDAEAFTSLINVAGEKRLYIIIHDISERMQTERHLKQARDMAEAASRQKSEFLANMSHEIRTPLNGIMGMLKLMDDTSLNQNQKELLEAALTSSQGLRSIINDILDLSQVEADKLTLREAPFSPHDLMDSLQKIFAHQCREKDLKCDFALDDKLPATLLGDESRVRQVIFNLVGNAIKFTQEGTINVSLNRLEASPDGRVRMLITVTDTGIGIPEDLLDILFEPFTQADGSLRRQYEGVGLGLSIVRRLVGLMEGNLSVDSFEGEGTTICIALPLAEVEAQVEEQKAAPIPEKDACKPKEGDEKPRILVAEDNRVNQIATRRFLQKLGYDPECVMSGAEAIDALRDSCFDAILMDIQMPGMDGVEATEIIRNDTSGDFDPQIPIIACTAHAMKGDREQFIEAGMNAYLAKPIELHELEQVMRKTLSPDSS